jgi:PhnB protein
MPAPAAKRAAPKVAGNAVHPARKDAPQMPLRTVTPHLVIDGASDAIAWYRKAFGAKELSRQPMPNGRLMHAAIQIGDSVVMLADSFGSAPTKMAGVTLHVHSPAIDALWAGGVANGGTVEMPLANQFWGDKYGQMRDPFGHLWSFGWPAKMTQAEKDRLQAEAMQMFAGNQHPGRDP